MNKWYLILIGGLILGYAGGAVVGPGKLLKSDSDDRQAPVVVKEAPVVASVEVAAAPAVDDKELLKLRGQLGEKDAEIASLSTALDDSRLEIAGYVAELDKLKSSSHGSRQADGKSWQDQRKEREEALKKENPEEYAAMEKRRKDFQASVEGAIAEKSSFLVDLDTSGMTEEELKGHNELLGRIAKGWETMNNIQNGKFPTREEMGAMHENYEAIRDLYASERDYVLREVGKGLGYDAKESADFSKYMQDVFEKTSASMPGGGMFGGRGRSSRSGFESNQPKPDPVAK